MAGRSNTSGRTLVRRKWSGHDVPRADSRGNASRAQKSSTTALSVKCPTCGRSVDANPRTSGASAAARARRSPSGSGSKPATTAPNGSVPPRRSRNAWAVRMISNELASHSSLVDPQAVIPCPPNITPIAVGCAFQIAAMSMPSWNPGRRHGTHTTRSPKHSLVSASPSTAVARAMPASGWRWSTWAAPTRACIAVSIEGAAPPGRAGSSRRRRPSRPRARLRGRRRRGLARGRGAGRPDRRASACRGRRPSP